MLVELHLGFKGDWTVTKTRGVVAKLTEAVKREFREAGDDVDVAIVLMPEHTAAVESAHAR
jgi:hypothetical protein